MVEKQSRKPTAWELYRAEKERLERENVRLREVLLALVAEEPIKFFYDDPVCLYCGSWKENSRATRTDQERWIAHEEGCPVQQARDLLDRRYTPS